MCAHFQRPRSPLDAAVSVHRNNSPQYVPTNQGAHDPCVISPALVPKHSRFLSCVLSSPALFYRSLLPPSTRVPTSSPKMTFKNSPGLLMLKTRNGIS